MNNYNFYETEVLPRYCNVFNILHKSVLYKKDTRNYSLVSSWLFFCLHFFNHFKEKNIIAPTIAQYPMAPITIITWKLVINIFAIDTAINPAKQHNASRIINAIKTAIPIFKSSHSRFIFIPPKLLFLLVIPSSCKKELPKEVSIIIYCLVVVVKKRLLRNIE